MVYEKAACKRFTGRFFMDVIPLLPLFPFNDGLRIVADERPFTVHDVQLQVHAAAAQGLYGSVEAVDKAHTLTLLRVLSLLLF